MRSLSSISCILIFLATSLCAQSRRLWVLRAPGEAVEYDPSTFAAKGTVKIPAEALASLQNLSINSLGQMLFAAPVALPLAEGDLAEERKVWIYDGHRASTLVRDVSRTIATAGSNLSIAESAPVPFLSGDGSHLFWFANQARRLQRDGVDLSTKTTWLAWKTDLTGERREEIVSVDLPDCSCPTGGCEETCPYSDVWVPDGGVKNFFLLTQSVSGQTKRAYKSTAVYQENSGQWTPTPVDPPLRNILDAANPAAILEAIPDTGCCGWSNESDDQTLAHLQGKTLTLFDELATYKNPDYDVSFFTQNGKLSPNLRSAAFTITSTAKPNTPIQLAEQGQASPEESLRIRKALPELPAVEVKSVEAAPRRLAYLPHATLVGWLSDKEILIVEDHQLVAYDVANATRRKSNVRVDDVSHVLLR